ncbi:MAG: ATP-binding protein [Actinobacteria bacterium]|nr:ATP-binding protein [Actinomycetota bacterium]
MQAAYPAVTEAGLGSQGVFIGRDAYGGSFVYDPWVLYGDGTLTNANTIVFGHVGFAKSALTKCMLLRQRVFGRQVEIVDPKGEYLALVRAIGGVVQASDVERHRAFDVVPGVGVSARKPRDCAVVVLDLGDRSRCGGNLGRRDDADDLRQRHALPRAW